LHVRLKGRTVVSNRVRSELPSLMKNLPRLPELTVEQVQAGARIGETWGQARTRMEAARYAVSKVPCTECGHAVRHYSHDPPPCLCLDCSDELIAELGPRTKAATEQLGLHPVL
jgi:ribosomal protein S27E